MNTRLCDCCGLECQENWRVEVGKYRAEWFVCTDCHNNVVPRISKETEVPLLSILFPFGGRR